jgi:hypothetical protein
LANLAHRKLAGVAHGSVLCCALLVITACGQSNTPEQIQGFCDTLAEVNTGSVATDGLAELDGHALVVKTLLERSPPTLRDDLARIHDTIDAWARAVSGEHSMIETFDKLSAPQLIGSEGRVTDFIAAHCGLDLGGRPWREADSPDEGGLCPGWPRLGTPLTFNHFPNLPDIAGSNYFGQNFLISKWASFFGIETIKGALVVEPGGRVEFHGQFPAARYFAFHPNDMDLNNLPTLRDEELQPDQGSVNPYREVAVSGAANFYTASLVFGAPPNEPEVNTRYVGVRKDGVSSNRFVVNLLRMYHVDAGNIPGSGGVHLPAVSIYDSDGELVRKYPQCDLFASDSAPIETQKVFPALPVIDHRARNPARWTTSSNFDAPSDTLANADVQYLATHYSSRYGKLFVVRGKYLTAPDTRHGESPASPDRQVRLYNLCSYNFWNGGANQCLLENDLSRDEDGFYTLVVSSQVDRPSNLEQGNATWLDWGPYLDGQLQYRFVYRENPYIKAIADAVDGKAVADEMMPYVPVASPCDTETYEAGGWKACFEQHGLPLGVVP